MHIQEFDYDLPPELVAQHPAEKRDHSRLMVLHRLDRRIEHRLFFEITDYLHDGDVLVLNDARVIPARLLGKKETGGRAEVFLLRHLSNGGDHEAVWHCLSEFGLTMLPPAVRVRVAVEAGIGMGWERYVGASGVVVGMNGFGASAPGGTLMEKFGFTPERVADAVLGILNQPAG